MIQFIDEHRDRFGVEAICRTLRATTCGFITSRAYRAAKTRPASARALRDEVLLPEIKRIHQENYSVYGVRKMHHAMLRSGWQIGRDQVARLMRIAGLQGVRRGRKPRTTRSAGNHVPHALPETTYHTLCRTPRYPPRSRRTPVHRRTPEPVVGCRHHLRACPDGIVLRRVHHRRLHPPHRGLGRLGKPAHHRTTTAGSRARPAEHRHQPRP